MALGICGVCGHADDIHQHHVAGRANYPDLTFPLCRVCHSDVHRRLDAFGVELRHEVDHTPVDRWRALFVGYSVLLGLHFERHPHPILPAELVTLMARFLAREMDRAEPPDRPGRWRPDPTVKVQEVTPAESREGGDMDMLSLFMHLVVGVADSLDRDAARDALEVQAFRLAAADPIAFMTHAEAELAAHGDGEQMLADMMLVTERIGLLLRFMATHDPDAEWPTELLGEPKVLADAQRRLLEQLIDLAGLSEQAPQ